jgi:hypothetical protein
MDEPRIFLPPEKMHADTGVVQYVETRGNMICLLIRLKDHEPYYAWLRQGETANLRTNALPNPEPTRN